jgi:hypothetical protein
MILEFLKFFIGNFRRLFFIGKFSQSWIFYIISYGSGFRKYNNGKKDAYVAPSSSQGGSIPQG